MGICNEDSRNIVAVKTLKGETHTCVYLLCCVVLLQHTHVHIKECTQLQLGS